MDELYRTQETMTATELARIAQITPSAMSYHLRELETHGIVRRVPDAVDGRERPWRAAAQNYSIVASDDNDRDTHIRLLDARLEPMRHRMQTVLARRSMIPMHERREPYMVLATGNLLLTDEELSDLQTWIDGIWQHFDQRSIGRTVGPQYRHSRCLWSCLPDASGNND